MKTFYPSYEHFREVSGSLFPGGLTLTRPFLTFPLEALQSSAVRPTGRKLCGKEAPVMINGRMMRKAVLSRMFEHLERTYGMDLRRDEFIGGLISSHELEGILSFKSDPRLDDLHEALHRIDDGTYGVCLSCKHEIGSPVLEEDPASRMCSVCEHEFNRPITHLNAVPHHA
jgi:hypothetical protein